MLQKLQYEEKIQALMTKRAHLNQYGSELSKNDREILTMQIMIDEHDINILEKEIINFIP